MNEIEKVVPIPIPKEIIEFIVSHVPSPPGVGKSAVKRAKDNLISLIRDDLSQYNLVPIRDAYDQFVTEYIRDIYKSFIDAGTPVGITCATSISAPITQISFNTHKTVGTESGIAQSFTLIRNILTGSKTDRSSTMKIMLKHPSSGTNLNNVLHVGTAKMIFAMREYFEETTVKMLIESHDIIDMYSPKYKSVKNIMALHSLIRPERFYENNGYFGTHIMELKLNTYRMYSHKITMYDIARTIEGPGSGSSEDSITCVWKSQRDGYIYVLIDEKKISDKNILDKSQAMIMTFQQYILAKCDDWVVKGIPGISVIEPVRVQVSSVINKVTEIGVKEFRIHISKYLTRFGASILDVHNLLHKLGYLISGYNYDELYINVKYTFDNFIKDYKIQLNFSRVKLEESITSLKDSVKDTHEDILSLKQKLRNIDEGQEEYENLEEMSSIRDELLNKLKSDAESLKKLEKNLTETIEKHNDRVNAGKITFTEHVNLIAAKSELLDVTKMKEIFKELGYEHKITKKGTLVVEINKKQFFNTFKNIVNKYIAEYDDYLKKDIMYDPDAKDEDGNVRDEPPTVDPEIEEIANAAEFSYINTIGVNYEEIIWRDDVDIYRSYPSSPHRIAELFGIDAATLYLIIQFNNTLAKYAAKVYLDPRHILLQFYMMTNIGQVDSLSITGINRRKIGPLAAASTGHAMKTILNAGVFSTKEPPGGVTTAACIGQANKVGTGMSQVFDDYDQSYTRISERDEVFEDKIPEVEDLASFLEEMENVAEADKIPEVDDFLEFLEEGGSSSTLEEKKPKFIVTNVGDEVPINITPKPGFNIIKPTISRESDCIPNIIDLGNFEGLYIVGYERNTDKDITFYDMPQVVNEYATLEISNKVIENCTQNVDLLKEHYKNSKCDDVINKYIVGYPYGIQFKIRTIVNNYNILYDNDYSEDARGKLLEEMLLLKSVKINFDTMRLDLDKSFISAGYEKEGCIDDKIVNGIITIGKYSFTYENGDRISFLRGMADDLTLKLMLLRYRNRKDASGAIFPKKVYELMHEEGFVNEAFASPLDSGLIEFPNSKFCSLYPDTDARYGSLGNFFKIVPLEHGNFWIVNPPQINDLYEKAKRTIIDIYSNNSNSKFILYSEFENDNMVGNVIVYKTINLKADTYRLHGDSIGRVDAKLHFIGHNFSNDFISAIEREFTSNIKKRRPAVLTGDQPPENIAPPPIPIPKGPSIVSISTRPQLRNPAPKFVPRTNVSTQQISPTSQTSTQNINLSSPTQPTQQRLPQNVNLPTLTQPSQRLPQNVNLPALTQPTQRLPQNINLPALTQPSQRLPQNVNLPVLTQPIQSVNLPAPTQPVQRYPQPLGQSSSTPSQRLPQPVQNVSFPVTRGPPQPLGYTPPQNVNLSPQRGSPLSQGLVSSLPISSLPGSSQRIYSPTHMQRLKSPTGGNSGIIPMIGRPNAFPQPNRPIQPNVNPTPVSVATFRPIITNVPNIMGGSNAPNNPPSQ